MNNNMNNTDNKKNSTAINLANLKAQFQVDLTAYKQAVADYMALLEKESSSYMIIGVGTNGNLYVKQSLNESDTWQMVNDNASGNIRSVCTGIDGRTIYCTDHNNDILYKPSWDAPTWDWAHSCKDNCGKFQGVAACPDGTLLGVGMDNVLYQIRSDGSFTNVKTSVNDGENLISVAIGLDGSVIVSNGAGNVYKKNSYQNLPSQGWQGLPGGCCIKAMTVAPDGTFIGVGGGSVPGGGDNFLYTKDSYTDLTTSWKGPYGASCCVVSITTVPKQKQTSFPFRTITVGWAGNLWTTPSLDDSTGWVQVKDNSNGRVRSVCTGSDGTTIYGTNSDNDMIYKTSWDAPTWAYHASYGKGKFIAVASCPDGTLLGVGMDNVLYKINSDGTWTSAKTGDTNDEYITGVTLAPDGSVFVSGFQNKVWKKNSYQNLPSQSWLYQSSCCITALTIAQNGTFIGVGTDRSLYTKNSYTDLTTPWKGPYEASCCVRDVTTVLNPASTQMVSMQSQTYWGKGQAGSQSVYTNVVTVDDCTALCSTTSGCSGATFNPIDHGQPMCWLRSGDSDIGPGLYNDYAIVPETKKYLEIMKSINNKLNATNKQIMDITMGSQGEYAGITSKSSKNHLELAKNFKVLQAERNKIADMLKKFDDLDESRVETELSTNQHYYLFILLSVIVIVVGFILYLCSFPNFTLESILQTILQTIQQGGTNISRFLFYAVILILIFILFIKSWEKLS